MIEDIGMWCWHQFFSSAGNLRPTNLGCVAMLAYLFIWVGIYCHWGIHAENRTKRARLSNAHYWAMMLETSLWPLWAPVYVVYKLWRWKFPPCEHNWKHLRNIYHCRSTWMCRACGKRERRHYLHDPSKPVKEEAKQPAPQKIPTGGPVPRSVTEEEFKVWMDTVKRLSAQFEELDKRVEEVEDWRKS